MAIRAAELLNIVPPVGVQTTRRADAVAHWFDS
jgi:hypothetical protein